MNAQLQNQPKVEPPPPAQPALRPARTPILQRKCACGGSSGSSGTAGGCDECKKDTKGVQLYSADRAPWSILLGPAGHGPQKNSKPGPAGAASGSHSFGQVRVRNSAPAPARKKRVVDEFVYGYGSEQETDQFSEQAPVATSVTPAARFAPAAPGQSGGHIGQQGSLNDAEGNRNKGRATSAEPVSEPAGHDTRLLPSLLVEDEATEFASGQMRKSDFLDQLEAAVRAAADSELTRVGRSAEECPYIARWMGYYRSRGSRHVEAALHRYAPESTRARSADEYIPVVARRVRRAASVWAVTGRITGLPDELASRINGGGALAAIDAFLSRTPGAPGDSRPRAASLAMPPRPLPLPAIAPTPVDNEVRAAGAPQDISSRLGPGGSLDTSVRSRMESAFGHDFSRVRVHTDGRAAALSANLNARAFTVGSDIAFAMGEYQPGRIVGEALIAHELAHVVQQEAAPASTSALREENEYDRLEQDADAAAVGAMASLWGGLKGALKGVVTNAKPALSSGLRLQRCKQETCSVGMKTVSIDLIKLRGAARSPQAGLATANQIYKKCCVQFSKGADKEAGDDLSDRWLGKDDTDLKVSGTCGSVEAEQKAMFDGAASEYKLSSTMRAFYVKSFSGFTAGGFSFPRYCATGAAAPYVNHIVLEDSAPDFGLAHELGHILLNSEKHEGVDDPKDANNLMALTTGSPAGSGEIDDSQCKTIYNNATT